MDGLIRMRANYKDYILSDEDLAEVMSRTARKLQEGFLFSFVLKNGKKVIDGMLLSTEVINEFRRNDYLLSPPYPCAFKNKQWYVKNTEGKYIIRVDPITKRYDVFNYGGLPDKTDTKEIKAILMSEIAKRDPNLIFVKRERLKYDIDHISAWDDKLGVKRAMKMHEYVLKYYKRKLDSFWKKACKQAKR